MDVNGDHGGLLGRAAGLRDALGSPDEEIPEAATEVEQRSGEDSADALKDQESRAGIDVSVSLTLKGKAECNKKHQRHCEIFQSVSHSVIPSGGLSAWTTLL